METFFRKTLKVINPFLLILSFLLFLWCIGSFIWSLSVNTENISHVLKIWIDYKFLVNCFGGCLTLWVISYNLKKFIDIETVKALGDLRTKLNDDKKKDIHTFLFPPEDKVPILKGEDKNNSPYSTPQFANADIFDYIGTIELGAIMVERGAITLDEFKNQFGYRVENIKNNSELMNHIKKYKKYYSNFLYLERKIQEK